MNLRMFHLVFVTFASTLCFVTGGWSLRHGGSAGAAYSVMGVLTLLVGISLVVYGVWFWRKIRTPEQERERRRKLFTTVSGVALLALLSGADGARACQVCLGDAGGPMVDAARMGVFLLLGVVLLVQGGFVLFFLYLRRRARRFGPQNVPPWWNTIEEPAKR